MCSKKSDKGSFNSKELAEVISNVGAPIICTNQNYEPVLWSPLAGQILGVTLNQKTSLKAQFEPFGQLIAELDGSKKDRNASEFRIINFKDPGGEDRTLKVSISWAEALGVWFWTLTDLTDLTEEARTKQDFSDFYTRHHLATEASGTGTWEWTLGTDIALYSAGFKKILGYEEPEFRNSLQFCRSLIHPQDLASFDYALHDCVNGASPQFECNFRMRHKTGHWIWISSIASIKQDAESQLLRMFGHHTEITALKKAQAEIERQKQVLEVFIESAPAEIAMLDHNLDLLSCSKSFRMLHRLEQSPLGQNILAIMPELGNEIQCHLDKGLDGDSVSIESQKVSLSENQTLWFAIEIRPWQNAAGETSGLILKTRDVSGQMISAEKLRQSETLLVKAQQIAKLGTWDISLTDGQVSLSEDIFKMIGRDVCQGPPTLGEFLKAMENSEGEDFKNFYLSAISGREVKDQEVAIKLADGTMRHIRFLAELELDKLGNVCHLWGTAQDITEDHHIQQELVLGRERAFENSRLKTTFLANMSHEIRTPMNGIIGMTDLLLQTQLNPSQRELSETIRLSGNNLLDILNDILDFSKIEAGKMSLEAVPTDISHILEDVLTVFRSTAENKGIQLSFDFDWKNPSSFYADPMRIRQIVSNLVGNAIKFTRVGSISVELQICKSGDVLIHVVDTGVGIASDRLKAVFESFTQADNSTTRRFGGTGLGLSLVKQVTELMGGKVELRSKLGLGSRFTIRLPLKPCPEQNQYEELLSGIQVYVSPEAHRVLPKLKEILLHFGVEFAQTYNTAANVIANIDELIAWRIDTRRGIATGAKNLDQRNRVLETGYAALPSTITPRILVQVLEYIENSELVSLPNAAKTDLSKLSVLVAEDDSVNRLVIHKFLDAMGIEYDTANDGDEAIQKASRTRYDVILMDLQMPYVDGIEATLEIRVTNGPSKNATIIAMTAHTRSAEIEKCLTAGMNAYLPKPIRREELRAMLQEAKPAEPEKAVEGLSSHLPFDEHYLMEICDGDSAFAEELINTYRENLGHLISNLEKSSLEGDFETAENFVHTLKGCSRSVGAVELAQIALELEEVIQTGRHPEPSSWSRLQLAQERAATCLFSFSKAA